MSDLDWGWLVVRLEALVTDCGHVEVNVLFDYFDSLELCIVIIDHVSLVFYLSRLNIVLQSPESVFVELLAPLRLESVLGGKADSFYELIVNRISSNFCE